MRPLSSETDREMGVLYDSGMTAPEIAHRYGKGPNTVYAALKRAGTVMRRPCPRPGHLQTRPPGKGFTRMERHSCQLCNHPVAPGDPDTLCIEHAHRLTLALALRAKRIAHARETVA